MKFRSAFFARPVAAVALALFAVAPCACAANKSDEAEIRSVIAAWYGELRKKENGRPRKVAAPGFIDATPHYRHLDTGAASAGPRVYTSLAATALEFTYDIERLRIDPAFAKVNVWERGYFYAWSAQTTYERAAATVFVLERQETDGRWLLLAHQTSPQGIPPGKHTNPMPDLRDRFYATEGKDRDPQADARNAQNR
ncbi:hypothetical protein W911_13625 [Hyphomicrobium nitrativorans NL23]|uniref:DUF4440 domain-containing protein n=1 Tax=Hyphomicrobium nitrativorans NL23 TaxID=1029756 RepID=V5SHH0_9HYPH|nr:hypothetical protein [Hyphomicrobium nitrativorans]AHB50296.1 hypothetical protein W911_13625 [Hyphomicrobium nitrativorans NL23]